MLDSQNVPEPPLTRFDALLALLVGGLSLALYVRTLAPSVLTGDSAEFQVLAYQMGIAHTPGYPVYIMLAKLFTYLPIGDIAYRVNLFSAFAAAVAVSGVYLATRLLQYRAEESIHSNAGHPSAALRASSTPAAISAGSTSLLSAITHERLAAVFGGLALAVGYTFWSQAIIAEVYTPGAALVALIWCGLLAWYRTGRRWPLFLAGICGGLSLGVHSTVALFAPAVLLFLWLNRRRWPNCWLPAVLAAAAGTLLYLLAFIVVDLNAPPANIFNAAYAPARSSWNLSREDLDSPVQRMIFNGTATQWRSAMFARWNRLPGQLLEYVGDLPRNFAALTLVLALAGLVLIFRRERSLGWLFLAALLVHWLFTFTYQIGDIYVFYIPGYVLMAMLAGYAAARIVGWLAKRLSGGARLVGIGALLAVLIIGVWPRLAPYWQAVRVGAVPFVDVEDYPVTSESAYRAAQRVVEQLPPDAVVFVDWSQLYTYYYAAHIEQGRLDLRFIEPEPRADRPGLPASAIEFIRENIATRPIFFTRPWPEVERAGYRFQAREIRFVRFYQVQSQ
jgi:hypothetical protein